MGLGPFGEKPSYDNLSNSLWTFWAADMSKRWPKSAFEGIMHLLTSVVETDRNKFMMR